MMRVLLPTNQITCLAYDRAACLELRTNSRVLGTEMFDKSISSVF